LKFSSEEGARLCNDLYKIEEVCFWDQAYQICSPSIKELARMRQNEYFALNIENKIKKGRGKLGLKISEIK
jgi:hypothetical protein